MSAYLKMAGFLLIFLGIVCGAHGLLYAAIVRFGAISAPGSRRLLFCLLMLLGVSFLPCALLMRTFPGRLTDLLYTLAAFWLGLFIYLLLGAALCACIAGVGRLAGLALNMRIIFGATVLIALMVAGYGTWRAETPVLKRMDITLKGLPEAWQGATVVQLSDVHLGGLRGPGFMDRVAADVNRVHPDLILITGDLFDGMGGRKLSDFIAPLNRLHAARGIYFVTGNHEGYLGLRAPLAALSKTDITVLDDAVVDVDGLQIIGIPFPEHGRENGARALLADRGTYDPEKPSILMYHTPTDIGERNSDLSSQQTNTYWRPRTGLHLAKAAGIDLQLSGHTHGGQFFPFTLIAHWIYRGYDYGLHRDGNLQIYITSGVGTWGPPMRVACPPEIPVIVLHRGPEAANKKN